MKKNLNKIVINLCALILVSACHTIDHKNQFIIPTEMNKQKINNKPEKIILKKQPLPSEKVILKKKQQIFLK